MKRFDGVLCKINICIMLEINGDGEMTSNYDIQKECFCYINVTDSQHYRQQSMIYSMKFYKQQ